MDVIDKINALLKEKGMTGAELSRAIGVSTAVYSQWNTRRTKPSNKSIAKVASALGVAVAELIDGQQKEKPAPITESELSESEKVMLNLFRQVSDESRGLIVQILETMPKKSESP